MKKKMRKFSEGGYSTVDSENPVPSIDEDTRSKAMKFVENASEESRNLGAPVTRSAAKTSSKVSETVAPPKMDMDAERARMDKLIKSQAIERVEPENYIPGPGMVKNLFKKAVEMGTKSVAKEATKDTAKEVASATSRVAKNDAAEAAVRSRATKVKKEANDTAETALRVRAAKARGKANDEASKKVRERAKKNDDLEGFDDGGSGAFKRGGKVSSASRRADGCAIRGKTRA